MATVALPRALGRSGSARPWQALSRQYATTSLSSTIKISSVPAPHAGNIAVVSFNRPRARNAISRQLLSELSGVVEGLHRERGIGSTRALILASESDVAFCAGADLKERLSMTPDEYGVSNRKCLTSTTAKLSAITALPPS